MIAMQIRWSMPRTLDMYAHNTVSFLFSGRFGFQKEMNALQSLTTGNKEENGNVTSLLKATHEVERRVQELYRWWRLWEPDVREGWQLLGRYKVRSFMAVAQSAAPWEKLWGAQYEEGLVPTWQLLKQCGFGSRDEFVFPSVHQSFPIVLPSVTAKL
jgi:hypothetical protein